MRELIVFLSTYNGEKYISQQLTSFLDQSYQNWDLIVSDDGSKDATLKICNEFKEKVKGQHEVKIVQGPRKGFVQNFLSMAVNSAYSGQFYAFSDQDDIWYADKLQTAVNFLKAIPKHVPALFCTRTELIQDNGKVFAPPKYSTLMSQRPCFENALVQSIAGGNTMVFNNAAKEILMRFGGVVDVASHDWWLYILVTGSGGVVKYDSTPSLGYRQHQRNLIGANRGVTAIFSRGCRFLRGDFKEFNDKFVSELSKNVEKLTFSAQETFYNYRDARKALLPKRLWLFKKSGVRRNGIQNVFLKIGMILNKV